MATSAVSSGTSLPGVTSSFGGVTGALQPGVNPNLYNGSGTGGFLGALFGSNPGVANPASGTQQAVTSNRQNLGNLANLTYGADSIGAEGAQIAYDQNLPGYQSNLAQNATNVGQELQGQVPQDVVNQITQQAAERGVATGQGAGSPNINAAMLSALGQNSEQQMATGQSGFSTLLGETPTGDSLNPETMMTTPGEMQSANQAVQNSMAAPNPSISGLMSAAGGSSSC